MKAAAKVVGEDAFVVAFEPEIARLLQIEIRKNDKYLVRHFSSVTKNFFFALLQLNERFETV